MPVSGGYFVFPSPMARTAAALTWSGVSKSGSPADRAMTSRPARAISMARAEITAAGEALMRLMCLATTVIAGFPSVSKGTRAR